MGPGRTTETVLANALKHPDRNIRFQAASTLASWNRVQFIEPIFEALKGHSRGEKTRVMQAFCDLPHEVNRGRSKDPDAVPTVSYNREMVRLFNAVLNAARANPVCLRATPYIWGNIVDTLKHTGRGDAKKVAACLADELAFFERASFKGKYDRQPLDQRRLLPTRWVPIIKRHGSTASPDVCNALEQMHRPPGQPQHRTENTNLRQRVGGGLRKLFKRVRLFKRR